MSEKEYLTAGLLHDLECHLTFLSFFIINMKLALLCAIWDSTYILVSQAVSSSFWHRHRGILAIFTYLLLIYLIFLLIFNASSSFLKAIFPKLVYPHSRLRLSLTTFPLLITCSQLVYMIITFGWSWISCVYLRVILEVTFCSFLFLDHFYIDESLNFGLHD